MDADAFDSVPLGATPDDIAKCSVASDSLKATCSGPHAVCLCHLDGGCGTVAKGDPVGVLDVNQDGAADNTSFKQGAVGIKCGQIDVPIDLDMSYWNPSGDQQVPAMGGFDALGPAIVLAPAGGTLPTNIACSLVFAPDVLDKQGVAVCAPPDGRPPECEQWPPPLNGSKTAACEAKFKCNPGDMASFSFNVEPLVISVQGLADNDINVDPAQPIFSNVNASIDVATLANVTHHPGAPRRLHRHRADADADQDHVHHATRGRDGVHADVPDHGDGQLWPGPAGSGRHSLHHRVTEQPDEDP